MDIPELVDAARAAAEGSYSPYSGFRVGAVVVGSDGEIFGRRNITWTGPHGDGCHQRLRVFSRTQSAL
jgi:cytidine deaminase